MQPKLRVGPSDDVYEREADQIATAVMRSPAGSDVTSTGVSVQRVGAGGAGTEAPASVEAVLASPGRPLDAGTRLFMENRMGADFSGVRVHTDSRAADSAVALNARAYTVGRDVAFAAGAYRPSTSAGRSLIAHELVHTLQQGGATPRRVQRAVRESVQRPASQPGAGACMVHLHGNEQNALQVAQSLYGTHCVNLVHLNSTGRNVHVDLPGGTCMADPNRVFSATGIRSHALRGRCSSRPAARTALTQFHDTQLAPAIRACRGGGAGTGIEGPLPVLALHNNTPTTSSSANLSINSYRAIDPRTGHRGTEAGATETAASRLGGLANPTAVAGQDEDNFFVTTDRADFAALRGTRNAVLQHSRPTDDGSLSVALAGDRYINVEAEGKRFTNTRAAAFVTNRTMAEEALAQFGVREKPCVAPRAAPGGVIQKQDDAPRSVEPGPEEGEPLSLSELIDRLIEMLQGDLDDPRVWERVQTLFDQILDWIKRLVEESVRVLQDIDSMPEALPRERPPSTLDEDCRTFTSQADLDTRKAHWVGVIGGMPLADVVAWIIGRGTPPRAATGEATDQRDCLLHAIRAAAARPGSGITLPTTPLSRSARRDFAGQERIWTRKFNFTGRPFDRISGAARATCGSLLAPGDVRWDPGNASHRACWLGTSPPAMPAGARQLTDDERQREILQASSAPGISRHHWGTDFDLFDPDMNPEEWRVGRPFADEYSWMLGNAGTYGFIQSFTATSTFMTMGYIEERWHWSYYPVAQALLEFARAHQGDVDAALHAEWGSARRFSFIARNWRSFVFNVSEQGRF